MDLRDLGECTMTFLDVEGNKIEITHQLYAGILAARNQSQLKQLFPSFFGKDLLDKYNLGLSKKDGNGLRYLE